MAVIAERMARIKHKVLVLSGKGGVGKSTLSAQLAFALAKQGKEVGLLDIDICGPSIPKMLGLEGEEIHQSNLGWSPVYVEDNLAVMSIGFMLPDPDEAVIWRGPRKNGLIKQFLKDVHWGELDYLVVDAPPGTSDEHITIAQCLQAAGGAGGAADGALIVTTPQDVAIIDVRKEISFCKKVGLRVLGVVENMAGLQQGLEHFTVHTAPEAVGANAAGEEEVDVTSEVQALLAERFPGRRLSLRTDVFRAGGGVQKMCTDMGVSLLGRVPLDPQLGRAAEEGRSVLNAEGQGAAPGDPVSQPVAACLPSLLAVVRRVIDLTEPATSAPQAV